MIELTIQAKDPAKSVAVRMPFEIEDPLAQETRDELLQLLRDALESMATRDGVAA